MLGIDSLKGRTLFFSIHNSAYTECFPRILLTPEMYRFFPILTSSPDTSWESCGLTQFRALTVQSWHRPKIRGLVPLDCPSSDAGGNWWVPKLPTASHSATHWSSPDPLLRFSHALEWLRELRNTAYLLGYLFGIKGTSEQPDEEYIGLGLCPKHRSLCSHGISGCANLCPSPASGWALIH